MARGTQFLQLVTMLKEELGRATDVSVGVGDVPTLKRKLNRYYETLFYDNDWPHLRRTFERIDLQAGEQFYDLPDDLDYERIESVVVYQSGVPIPLDRGISSEDYAAFDSVNAETSSPALKWDVRDVDGATQIEIWPIPSGDGEQKLEIKGLVKFTRLVEDEDRCLLDDNLVVGFAAAEILAKDKSGNADSVASSAQSLYDKLRGRTKGASKTYSFADRQPTVNPGRVTVRISG